MQSKSDWSTNLNWMDKMLLGISSPLWTPLIIGSQSQVESRATVSVSRPSSIECFHHGVWLNHQLRGYKFPKVEAKYFHGGFQGHGIPAKIISIKLHCYLFAWGPTFLHEDLPFCMGTYLFAWGPTIFQWEPTWEQKLTKNTMKGYRPCYNLLFMEVWPMNAELWYKAIFIH